MRIISKAPLREFWEKHPAVALPLQVWYKETTAATWQTPNDVKAHYRNASIVGNNRVVFNIKGNDFRLIVAIRLVPKLRKTGNTVMLSLSKHLYRFVARRGGSGRDASTSGRQMSMTF